MIFGNLTFSIIYLSHLIIYSIFSLFYFQWFSTLLFLFFIFFCYSCIFIFIIYYFPYNYCITDIYLILLIESRSVADIFRINVISNPNVRSPVLTFGSTTFFHIRNENMFIAAVSKQNALAALVLLSIPSYTLILFFLFQILNSKHFLKNTNNI